MKNKIAYYRSKLNMSQEELAARANVSRPYLSEIENDKSNLSGEIMLRISKALDKKVEEIFFDTDVNYNEQKAI